MARPPVRPYKTTPLGEYGAIRTDPTKASCGIGKHPCRHQGVDLVGEPGTVVQAPCDGWVIVSQATNNPPFSGYGPSVVLFAHDDSNTRGRLPGEYEPRSLRYSLLGHLDPAELRYQVPYKLAESTLVQSVRQAAGAATPRLNPDWTLRDDGTLERVSDWPSWARRVKEGEWLGKIGGARHVHWEVRSQPLGGDAARLDPRGWLSAHDSSQDWEHAPPSPVRPTRGGGGIALLLAGLGWLMFEDR